MERTPIGGLGGTIRSLLAVVVLCISGLFALQGRAEYRAIVAHQRIYSESYLAPVSLDDAGRMIYEELNSHYPRAVGHFHVGSTGEVTRLDTLLGVPSRPDPAGSTGVSSPTVTSGGLIAYGRLSAPGGVYLFDPARSETTRLDTLGVYALNDARLGLAVSGETINVVELPAGASTPIIRATVPTTPGAQRTGALAVDAAGRVALSSDFRGPSGPTIAQSVFNVDLTGGASGTVVTVGSAFPGRRYESWVESTNSGHFAFQRYSNGNVSGGSFFHQVLHVRPDGSVEDLNAKFDDPGLKNLEVFDIAEDGRMLISASNEVLGLSTIYLYDPASGFERWRFSPISVETGETLLSFTPYRLNAAGQFAGVGLLREPSGELIDVVATLSVVPEPVTLGVLVASALVGLSRRR